MNDTIPAQNEAPQVQNQDDLLNILDDQWIIKLQQRYDSAVSKINHAITNLQEHVIDSTARLENFINSYTVKIQNMDQDIATFDNTLQLKTAQAYDKITEATNKALYDICTSVSPLIKKAKDHFTSFRQEHISEADRTYEDLVEQAVSTIYEKTQEVLDQITEHQENATITPPTVIPTAARNPHHNSDTSPRSANVRNHTTYNISAKSPTPWSTKHTANNIPVSTQPTQPKAATTHMPHCTPPPPKLEGINVESPVSPYQLDHQKFIKYVKVTYCGNIFEFYNKLQNFGLRWGVALKGIKNVKHGQSLCPELVNGEPVTPSDYN
jgi:vacuolar-type H+-ATPase subunit E/Vma4